jgi:peroxiredoxin Q/BCP
MLPGRCADDKAPPQGAGPPGPFDCLARRTAPGYSLRQEEADMLQAGDAAPAFAVRDHLGNEVSLAALRGKTVVLWFFPKADTPG